jgi:hypothetical protein
MDGMDAAKMRAEEDYERRMYPSVVVQSEPVERPSWKEQLQQMSLAGGDMGRRAQQELLDRSW